jgi:hypothetical protein
VFQGSEQTGDQLWPGVEIPFRDGRTNFDIHGNNKIAHIIYCAIKLLLELGEKSLALGR